MAGAHFGGSEDPVFSEPFDCIVPLANDIAIFYVKARLGKQKAKISTLKAAQEATTSSPGVAVADQVLGK